MGRLFVMLLCIACIACGGRLFIPVEQGARGSECSQDAHCFDGDVCVIEACVGACEPAAARGEQCFGADDLGGCSRGDMARTCEAGLSCVVVTRFISVGTCVPRDNRVLGEPCIEDAECGDGLRCDAGRQRCAAVEGTACADDEECASGLCGPNALCAANECAIGCDDADVCAGGPCGFTCEVPGERGDECLFFSDENPCPRERECAAPLVCGERNFGKFGDGVCVPIEERAAGEPCASDAQCALPLTCSQTELSCG